MHLDFAQRHTHVNAMDVRMHSHRALELVYYVKGKGETKVNNEQHSFRRGIFAVIPADMPHDQIDHGPVTSLCFGLTDSKLEPLAGVYRDPDGELMQICQCTLDELAARKTGWQEMVNGLLLQMSALVRRAAEAQTRRRGKPELVNNAISIIHNRDGVITVSELSEQLFVSHDYLRHLFQEYDGQSPMRHIIRTRIKKACGLLADTDLPVAKIAARTGFESPYYFSRLFKQIEKQTPSSYRKKNNSR